MRPTDLRRTLVLTGIPGPRSGLAAETIFAPGPGRYLAGVFRTPSGDRIAVAVDPAMPRDGYALEDSLTGRVVHSGTIGERLASVE